MLTAMNRRRLLLGAAATSLLTVGGAASLTAQTVAQLADELKMAELRLRIARERYARGEIPQHWVKDLEKKYQVALQNYQRAQGGTSKASSPTTSNPQSSSSSPPKNGGGSTVTVNNGADLQRALGNLRPGMTIVMANGTYSGSFAVKANGTSSSRITIRAANKLGAKLRSYLTVNGAYVSIWGLSFENTGLAINKSDCSVSASRFTGGSARISLNGAANAKIHNNEFSGWGDRCIAFNPLMNGQGRNPHIYSNYFHDSRNVCISLGFQEGHQRLNVGALVENNLFINATHDQVVNIKSSGNRIRGNTILKGGALVTRLGLNNVLENNWLENCKGLWLSDANNSAIGNKLINCDLLVLAGTITSANVPKQNGGHPRAESSRVVNNVARRLIIGQQWSYNLPAINTVVEGHNGRIDRGLQQGTQIRSTGNRSAGSAARKLGTGNVGV